VEKFIMVSRTLHILGPVRDRMDAAVFSALESACEECEVQISTTKPAAEIARHSKLNIDDYVLTDTSALVHLISEHGFSPNSTTILVIFDRENPSLSEHLNALTELRYLISGFNAGIIKAAFSAIFRHNVLGNILGLEASLIEDTTQKTLTHTLSNSSERSKSQNAVTNFFSTQISLHQEKMAAGISSYPKHMADILDELLMNAIWDASQERNMSNRAQSVDLQKHEQVTLKATCDEKSLILNVTDFQGSFPASIIHCYIRFALGFRDNKAINDNAAGAGLGLYMILQKVAALSIEVEKGKFTRVCAVIRGDQSLREMQKRPRTVLFLESESKK